MEFCNKLIISPINKDRKSNSNLDFHEQKNGSWCWDDSKSNSAKKNEYFAFYFHNNQIIIHRILDVKSPAYRLPSWSKNVGQGDRNVLELSDPLKVISWDEWIGLHGPTCRMCTYPKGTSDRPLLFRMLMNLEFEKDNKQFEYELARDFALDGRI